MTKTFVMPATGGAEQLHGRLRAAIAEHGLWKVRLREYVRSGRGELDVATARADDVCSFGHWMYAEADECLRERAEFAEIREIHSDFHLVSGEVLELMAAGRQAEAEAMIGFKGRWSRLAVALTARLMAWQKTL